MSRVDGQKVIGFRKLYFFKSNFRFIFQIFIFKEGNGEGRGEMINQIKLRQYLLKHFDGVYELHIFYKKPEEPENILNFREI